MPINAQCSQCGAILPVPDEFAGKSVRCGGCQSVVNVPLQTLPVAKVVAATPKQATPTVTDSPPVLTRPPRARPVAAPVARTKRDPEPVEEKPIRKARKAKNELLDEPVEDSTATEEEVSTTSRRRPIAKRRRESVMTVASLKWLFLMLGAGAIGLGVLGYAAIAANRKNDGTAIVPPAPQANNNPIPLVANAAPPVPNVPKGAAIQFERPEEFQPVVPPPNQFGRLVPQRAAIQESSNALIRKFAQQLTIRSSSDFQGGQWSKASAFDRNSFTSWYSSGQERTPPWIEVNFPEAVTVNRVVILGNRDTYGDRYTITSGTLTIYDSADRLLVTHTPQSSGPRLDFEYQPNAPLAQVKRIRFTATSSTNQSMCVAVAEFQVE